MKEFMTTILPDNNYTRRYRIELSLVRKVKILGVGYYYDEINFSWSYGKNKTFKSSKDGIKFIENIIDLIKDKCSEIYITVWNGNSGDNIEMYKSEKYFLSPFTKSSNK